MKSGRVALPIFLVLSVLLMPLAAEGQSGGKIWRVGLLSPSADIDKSFLAGLQDGLRDLQYVEGKNVTIERRYADGLLERLPELAADLVRSKVDIFVVHGFRLAVRAAEQASSAIPLVFVANPDPVGAGLVASLARPGGRVTGLSDSHSELVGKRLALLKEAVPSVSRVAVLHSTEALSLRALEDTQTAASALRLTIVPVTIKEPRSDIDSVFTVIRRERAEALNVLMGAGGIHQRRIADVALKNQIPTIGTTRRATESGYLMSYGANFPALYYRAATYVDKILKGTNPGDLPIEQPTKFELVVNLKTAKALGLTIPPSLLLRADQVIE